MLYLIFLCVLSLVSANECLLDDTILNYTEHCYNVVKPILLYLPAMQKRVEACETLKPPYAQERLANMEMAMNQLQLSSAMQLQALLSWKTQVEAEKETCDNRIQQLNNSLAACQMETQAMKNQTKDTEMVKKSCKFQQIGSKCYYIESQQNETWLGALHSCLRLGSHLASPQNAQELDELSKLLQSSGNTYWLDIHNHLQKDEYMSVTTGKKANYLRWNINEPNHAQQGENCVELKPNLGKMNDRVCTSKISYICEVKM